MLQEKKEVIQPKNVQPPLQQQRNLSQTHIPAANLYINDPLTDEEDGDFEEQNDDDDTAAALKNCKKKC